jgi:hypothetical protein
LADKPTVSERPDTKVAVIVTGRDQANSPTNGYTQNTGHFTATIGLSYQAGHCLAANIEDCHFGANAGGEESVVL